MEEKQRGEENLSNLFYKNLGTKLHACRKSQQITLQQLSDKLGMLSSITFYYQNIAIKVLASETPIADRNYILDKLQFSQDDIKRIKQFNFLFLKE
ncbi:MAG: hypothetical protein HFG51_05590 [Lachnospiraceae bacterium]|nr:hypothetical protein [Lachnospiraceae bacterium]